MTDAELQALWDKNVNAPPPKRLSEDEFFKKYGKAERSGGGFGIGTGALALGDFSLGLASKTLDMLIKAPEGILGVLKGESPDEELAAFYGRDVSDSATARYVEENPVLSALTGYRARTKGGQLLEHGEEWVMGKLSALGEKAYDISKGDPMRTYTEEDTPISRAAAETSSYLGNLFGSAIKYGVPFVAAHRAAKAAPAVASATRDVAGSGIMGGAGLAQRALPGSNVLESAGRFVGENRLKTTNFQLQQLNNRREFAYHVLGQDIKIPDWYTSPIAKMFHAVEMAHTGLKQRKNATESLDGFTPNVIAELESTLREMNQIKQGTNTRVDRVSDIFHGQVAHILTTMQKMEPYSARTKLFEERFGSHIFPDNVKNVAARFSSNDVLQLMDRYLGEPLKDTAILDAHVTPFVKMGQKSGIIHMSTKAFHKIRNNLYKMGYKSGFTDVGKQSAIPNQYYGNIFSFKGYLPLIHQVNRLMKEQGPNATKESIISSLKKLDADLISQHKLALKAWEADRPVRGKYLPESVTGGPPGGKKIFGGQVNILGKEFTAPSGEFAIPYKIRMKFWNASKPKEKTYAALNLEKNIVDSGGYISVGQQVLSLDTLLATIFNRAIFDKANPSRGAVFNYDSYQLGTGKKYLDKPFTMGADTHRIFMDIIPWSKDFYDMVVGGREGGGAVISQLPAVETRMVAPRGRPRTVETRPSVERDVPLGQASLYKAPLQQMKKFGIM